MPFLAPLTEADRAEHNLGRRHFHDKQPWESLRPGSHALAGWAAAATEEADEAQRRRTAQTKANVTCDV